MRGDAIVEIVPLSGDEEAQTCATLMCHSEPWITLNRSHEQSLRLITDPSREVYLAKLDGLVVGFIILCLHGAFVGYIQTVCVAADYRGRNLGSRLIAFAEQRIFGSFPNAFMCVSSFNVDAKRLYLRLGYEVVGELRDFIVKGHAEILLRKTIGPISQSDASVRDRTA